MIARRTLLTGSAGLLLGGCDYGVKRLDALLETLAEPEQAAWWAGATAHAAPWHLAAMRAARFVYDLRAPAGYHPMRFRFQWHLARAIAAIAEGVINDPQASQYFFARQVRLSSRSPVEQFKYVIHHREMHKRGFFYAHLSDVIQWVNYVVGRDDRYC